MFFNAHHLTIDSYISACSSRYEAHGKFGEHERCVRVAQGIAESNSSFFRALQTSQVLHISTNTSWRMNQLFYYIFNPMENFFSQGICLLTSWACTIGIWSTIMQLDLIWQIYQPCCNCQIAEISGMFLLWYVCTQRAETFMPCYFVNYLSP